MHVFTCYSGKIHQNVTPVVTGMLVPKIGNKKHLKKPNNFRSDPNCLACALSACTEFSGSFGRSRPAWPPCFRLKSLARARTFLENQSRLSWSWASDLNCPESLKILWTGISVSPKFFFSVDVSCQDQCKLLNMQYTFLDVEREPYLFTSFKQSGYDGKN